MSTEQSTRQRDTEEVLRFTENGEHRNTVRRHYIKWRLQQDPPRPVRCDIPCCKYYSEPLVWNDIPFSPILDHINGVNSDNRAKNLRFLCPNCDSQQETRGGRNKGRVIKSSGGFAKVADDGKKHYTLPAEVGKLKLSGGAAGLVHRDADGNIVSSG
jgi:hypothetical protein